MCSVDPDNVEELMQPKEQVDLTNSLCRKCSIANGLVVLQGKFAYCRQCFIDMVSHKFYATLGKSKILKSVDKLLVAFSGSLSSVALVHLVKDGLSEIRKKKLVSEVIVTYIDEGAVIGMNEEQRLSVINDVKSYLVQYNFKIIFVNLTCRQSDISVYENSVSTMMTENKWDDSAVNKLFDSIPSLTAKEDLLLKLRQNLIVQVAKKFDCKRILTAETSEHIGTAVLSNIALGRGAQLSLDVGFCDDRFPDDVVIVRPLKDWSKKEVAFYNKFNNLQSITVPSLGTMAKPLSSIQKLTEKFVTELQAGFPSTVSTIVRTAHKLATPQQQLEDNPLCLLCQAKIEDVQTLSAPQSRKMSHVISTLGSTGFDPLSFKLITDSTRVVDKEECVCTGAVLCPNTQCSYKLPQVNIEQLEQCLCYGCQLIFNETDSIENWPPIILYEIQKRSRLNRMRNEIHEFLL